MGACLKRSGMLLMAPIDIPEDVRMHKEEQQILMALYNLVRTELFRILKIDASENGKEGAFAATTLTMNSKDYWKITAL